MDYELSPFIRIVDVVFSLMRLFMVLWLWNQFVPVIRRSKSNDGDTYMKKNEVAAVIVILGIIFIISSFLTTDLPITTLALFGVIIPFVLFSAKDWVLESVFTITLFWHITSMSYFVVVSATDFISKNLMNGIEAANDIEHFVSVRIGIFEVVLFAAYTIVCAAAIVSVAKIVKHREKIHLQELLFLAVLNAAGIIMTFIMRSISIMSIKEGAVILTEEKPELLWQLPIIAVLLYLGELSAIYMWQENNRYRKRSEMYMTEKLEKEAMKQRLEETQEYYEKIRKVRHDMATHLTNIRGLSEHGYEKELAAYIKQLDEDISSVKMAVSTGNPVTDMVINDRFHKAKKAGVLLSVDMGYQDAWGISAYDIGIVIGNILDNAIREAEYTEAKNVSFQIREKAAVILVLCENDYLPENGREHPENEWHGLGLKNVEDIAERYDGAMRIEKKEGHFSVSVMLKKR